MDISELWEEVTTSFTFIRATDIEPTTHLKKMAERFQLVLKDITGDYEDLKLEKYESMRPPCKTGHAGYTYCVNEYSKETPYNTRYDEWIREEICHDCVGTEFCLCGQLIRYRYYLRHLPTEKIMCVGSCCIRKINPELADDMEKGCCYECDDTLRDKTQAYQKLGYCTLECLEISNPTHELLKKCGFPPCRIYLYPIKKLHRNYCAMLCKTKHKELIKALKKLEKKKEKDENIRWENEQQQIRFKLECFENEKELARRMIEEEEKEDALRREEGATRDPRSGTEGARLKEQKLIRDEFERNLKDPNVTILCDCEKFYISYKVRITQKDPLCFVCFTRKVKKEPVTYAILQWMAKNDLVHALTLEDK